MAVRVKISSKNQIAVPAEVRKKLQVGSGDYLILNIQDDTVVMMPEPRSFSEYMRGLHSEIWQGVDPDEYVRREHEEW